MHPLPQTRDDLQRRIEKLESEVSELRASHRRIVSEVKAENDGLKTGIQSYVETAIKRSFEPYAGKLDVLVKLAEEARDYRKERELREEISGALITTLQSTVSADEKNFAKRLRGPQKIWQWIACAAAAITVGTPIVKAIISQLFR